MPTQRLLENTPRDHPDHALLLEAEQSIHKVALAINSTKESRQEEDYQETLKKLELLLITDVRYRCYLVFCGVFLCLFVLLYCIFNYNLFNFVHETTRRHRAMWSHSFLVLVEHIYIYNLYQQPAHLKIMQNGVTK